MSKLGDTVKSADWKSEKHAPVIECADSAKAGEALQITVSVGKEIPHPNNTEHHISWIQVYFQPDDGGSLYQLAEYRFTAHGESPQGAYQGPAYTEPVAVASCKLGQSGTIIAMAFCNIHGLWESSRTVSVS